MAVATRGPIDVRIRQMADGEWLAVARRGLGPETGNVTTAYADGPAAAADAAIRNLLDREAGR